MRTLRTSHAERTEVLARAFRTDFKRTKYALPDTCKLINPNILVQTKHSHGGKYAPEVPGRAFQQF